MSLLVEIEKTISLNLSCLILKKYYICSVIEKIMINKSIFKIFFPLLIKLLIFTRSFSLILSYSTKLILFWYSRVKSNVQFNEKHYNCLYILKLELVFQDISGNHFYLNSILYTEKKLKKKEFDWKVCSGLLILCNEVF